jgi:hypothetical protein
VALDYPRNGRAIEILQTYFHPHLRDEHNDTVSVQIWGKGV